MTDYENDFPSINEVGNVYLQNVGALGSIAPEKWPQTNTRIEVNELETLPLNVTGKTHKEVVEARMAEPEEEEEEDEEEDDDEDEEGDEEEGGDDEDEEEDDDDEEEEEGIPADKHKRISVENGFFRHHDTLRGKYNERELDSFMKLLNVKPTAQW